MKSVIITSIAMVIVLAVLFFTTEGAPTNTPSAAPAAPSSTADDSALGNLK
jgi:hypothetical protein